MVWPFYVLFNSFSVISRCRKVKVMKCDVGSGRILLQAGFELAPCEPKSGMLTIWPHGCFTLLWRKWKYIQTMLVDCFTESLNTYAWRKIYRASPVAEWLRLLIFSTLNHSSSHRCGFEPRSGHLWNEPSSACEMSGFFLGDLQFSPHLLIDSAQNEWNNLDRP